MRIWMGDELELVDFVEWYIMHTRMSRERERNLLWIIFWLDSQIPFWCRQEFFSPRVVFLSDRFFSLRCRRNTTWFLFVSHRKRVKHESSDSYWHRTTDSRPGALISLMIGVLCVDRRFLDKRNVFLSYCNRASLMKMEIRRRRKIVKLSSIIWMRRTSANVDNKLKTFLLLHWMVSNIEQQARSHGKTALQVRNRSQKIDGKVGYCRHDSMDNRSRRRVHVDGSEQKACVWGNWIHNSLDFNDFSSMRLHFYCIFKK